MVKPARRGRPSGSSGGVKPGQARIRDKTTVEVNLKGIEAGRRRRVRIPEGNYLARVHRAVAKPFKTGNPGVEWQFAIADGGKYDGQVFYYNTMLMQESLWSFRAVLQALEPAVKISDSAQRMDLSRLINRTCAIEVVDGEYENKIRSEINDVFHQSQLEEEEEEFEDEEEEDEEVEEEEEEEAEEEWEDEEEEGEEEEEEGEEEEIDLEAMTLADLKELADEEGISTKPSRGKQRLTAKQLRARLQAHFESESGEEIEDIDLDDEDL